MSAKGLSKSLWAIISKVRNWPYKNIALIKYSDSIYKISVILERMDFPPAKTKPKQTYNTSNPLTPTKYTSPYWK